jgi:hypothetical protein
MVSGRTHIVDNIVWGVRWGLYFAGAASAFALGVFLLRGREPFEANRVGLFELIGTYVAGGVGGGFVVGLCRPLMRSGVGAALVGLVAAIPVGAGFIIAITGLPPWQWGVDQVGPTLLFAVVEGPLVGFVLWRGSGRFSEP